MNLRVFIATLLLAASSASGAGPTLRTATALNDAVFADFRPDVGFDIEATVVHKSPHGGIMFVDKTGSSYAVADRPESARVSCVNGDVARIQGCVVRTRNTRNVYASCTNLTLLRHGKAVPPVRTTVGDILDGTYDFLPVCVRGTVRGYLRDQIDSRFEFLLLDEDGETIPIPRWRDDTQPPKNRLPVGCEIEVTGLCEVHLNDGRRFYGRLLSPTQPIRMLRPAPRDPFDAEPIGDLRRLSSRGMTNLGRRRVQGSVLAVCSDKQFVLRSADGQVHAINHSSETSPAVGATVTVSGYPETDLFTVNFYHAIWRREGESLDPPDPAKTIGMSELFTSSLGAEYQMKFHGKAVCTTGLVIERRQTSFTLKSGNDTLLVNAAACPDAIKSAEPGSTVRVSGICFMNVARWHANDIFPLIHGVSVVLRTADDVEIVAAPPWLTTVRLLGIILSLAVCLVAVILWNVVLRNVSERRGHELAGQQLALVKSKMKTDERTRLAVELHDSIIQTLTGAALEVKAASRFAETDLYATKQHLGIAAKAIDSCRSEVRNCIWDLRSKALDETDLNVAIHQALEPHLGKTRLTMRFGIPRNSLSENALHAFIRIIRELTVNAIRHGRAESVWIAGSVEGDSVMFSVRDNGCGFDPETCPGMEDGHFGIQGIRERIRRLGGRLTFKHLAKGGMKATVILNRARIQCQEQPS